MAAAVERFTLMNLISIPPFAKSRFGSVINLSRGRFCAESDYIGEISIGQAKYMAVMKVMLIFYRWTLEKELRDLSFAGKHVSTELRSPQTKGKNSRLEDWVGTK